MSRPAVEIPREIEDSQRRASDPAVSAWVSANAGSGKTHVLANRVIRLLLAGTSPERILCLTYTKAAAANMSNRVFQILGRWTTLPDAELAAAMDKMEGRRPGAEKLAAARRLFARALETPGGLKIQTIHAFCEALLHRFPLEGNIAGHFELLDGRMEQALVGEARRDMLTRVAGDASGGLAAAFGAVLEAVGESGLDALLGEIVGKRDKLDAILRAEGGPEGAHRALLGHFGFGEDETDAALAEKAWPLPGFDPAFVRAVDARALALGAVRARESCSYAAALACDERDPLVRLTAMAAALLSGKGEPYKPDWLFSAALRKEMPDLAVRYLEAAEAAQGALDRIALRRMLDATRAALTLAEAMTGRYEALKRARGFLDFNDLIRRTALMLKRPDAGAWVQYKLDQGIDHILVDEAQDTSPDQWDVVTGMTSDFFSGEGARSNVNRTVFAVGDEKQSIYSFQGAEPAAFSRTRHHFAALAGGAGRDLLSVRLHHSFRSTPDLLAAVDLVFGREEARRGLTVDPEELEHKAVRAAAPGHVEVWASLAPQEAEQSEDWRLPVDHAAAPAVMLADAIARTIALWLERGERLEGQGGRLLTPGDVMVLVRKRDRFIHALSRRLKELGVAVSGADRLSLPAHIAVKDLTAIGRFVLQPHDDLSLAAILKSPAFGLDDDDLMRIALDRNPAQSLFQRLRQIAPADPRLAEALERLEGWRREAGFRPAAEFYAALLSRDGLRRDVIARLGPEAGEILDEFLSFALAAEKTGNGDLAGLIALMDASPPEIKREMDQTRSEVRIMTVHAAKGLEAPVVFLVDSGSQPFSASHRPALGFFAAGGRPAGLALWRGDSDTSNSAMTALDEAARQAGEEEYRRLLYVGMTRAEDRLIVCGYHGRKGKAEGAWHGLVETALAGAPETRTLRHPFTGGEIMRYRVTPPARDKANAAAEEAPPAFRPLPFDPGEPVAPADAAPRPLSPSGAALLVEPEPESPSPDGRSPVLDDDGGPSLAVERGLAAHRLLQMLPEMAEGARAEAASTWLAAHGAHWPQAERERVKQRVLAVLADERFAPVFAPGSRAEAAVAGMLEVQGRKRMVSGKIDRISVTGDAVLVTDFKTGGRVPERPEAVDSGHLAQLALYRALLRNIYPDRAVRCALVFLDGPHLVELPADAMDSALARIAGA